MIFLASPYSDPDAEVRTRRYQLALEFCAVYLASDKPRPIYSPIVHWHPVAEFNPMLHDKDTEFWMNLNRPMLEICDELWVLALRGWRESVGVSAEVDLVTSYGRAVLLCLDGAHGITWWERIA